MKNPKIRKKLKINKMKLNQKKMAKKKMINKLMKVVNKKRVLFKCNRWIKNQMVEVLIIALTLKT